MKKTIAFLQATEAVAIKVKVSENLSDLNLKVFVAPADKHHPHHKLVTVSCGMGFPRDTPALAFLELALVTKAGRREEYTSGVANIYVHHDFKGLNIGPILVRNSLDLFKENGDRNIECNTVSQGACFWQKMGWLPTKHGTEFGETLLDDDVFYAGWETLLRSLKRKPYDGTLQILRKSEENVRAALSLLDENDPSSIWNFIDSGIKVDALNDHNNQEQAVDFASLALRGEKVNTVLSLDSNMQMDRFASSVSDLVFDKERFQKIWHAEFNRHVNNINAEARLYGFKPIDLSAEL